MKITGLRVLTAAAILFTILMIGIYIGKNTASQRLEFPQQGQSQTGERGKLDINTATEAQLSLIPDIGPTIARKIVEYRQENGPFTKITELANVDGIGLSRLQTLEEYVAIHP